MDTFLNGLDGRLRASGMVADSIMMGIVNSAMDNAYKKSCTKEGDFERLNEKSRFCELAIMQLEWCIKYLQEETDDNIFDETCDREGLLYDLLETRDRIHHRLEETEVAIAEKDKELLELKEIEVDLRLALEMRDEDIISLNVALGFEREKSAKNYFPCESKVVEMKGVDEINELKDRVDQQIERIRGKLEVGKLNLIEMMKAQHLDLLSLENLERSEHAKTNDEQVVRMIFDGGRTFNHEMMDQLAVDLEEMVVGMNIIKEKVDSSFGIMANSISSFKTELKEQQWIWNFEKETANLITQGFLKNMQNRFSNELGGSREDLMPFFLNLNWSTLTDDIRKLHNVLDILSTMIQMQLKVNLDADGQCNLDCNKSSRSKSFIGKYASSEGHGEDEDGCNLISIDGVDSLVEDDSCKLSSKRSKSYSENEPTREKLSVDLVSKKIIRNSEVIVKKENQDIDWILTELAEGKGSLGSIYYYSLQFVEENLARVIPLLEFVIRENLKFSKVSDDHDSLYGKDQKLKDGVREFHLHEETRNNLCYQPTNSECNGRRQVEQEKFDLEVKSMISHDIYLLLLESLIKRIHCESIECDIEAKIREEICEIILSCMFEEWRKCNETYKMASLLLEELYRIVFARVVKDVVLSLSCNSKIFPWEVVTFNEKVFQSCQRVDMFNQIYQETKDSLKFIRPTQQIYLSKQNFGEFPSSLGSICKNVSSKGEQEKIFVRAEKYCHCLPQKFEDKHFCQLQFMLFSFAKVSQQVAEFELVVYDKMHLNVKRLEYLSCELKPLVDRVKLVKQNELQYQKAFIRRCYDLQTAEKEVDLLGDQVDVLLDLVEKIYSTLLHYSPMLGNISKIMDVLRLIEQELRGESSFTS